MEVGRFYERRRQWIAAGLRFRKVIDSYQTTTHTPEALERLVESYLALGLVEEAKRSAAVLSANYPGSEWYQRAFDLMQKYQPGAVTIAARPAGRDRSCPGCSGIGAGSAARPSGGVRASRSARGQACQGEARAQGQAGEESRTGPVRQGRHLSSRAVRHNEREPPTA